MATTTNIFQANYDSILSLIGETCCFCDGNFCMCAGITTGLVCQQNRRSHVFASYLVSRFYMFLFVLFMCFYMLLISILNVLYNRNYPHQDQTPGKDQIRASAHTDYGSLTILAVDDAPGGLQVQDVNDQWESVKAPSNSFVVNLGDLMARWTNDEWRSTMHRVINPPQDDDQQQQAQKSNRRQSIAFFHCINYDAVVECIESCKSPENPPKYEPILAGVHLLQKHEAAQARKK